MIPDRWPIWRWDPEAASALFAVEGLDDAEVERVARLKPGRLDQLAENGWDPHVFEVTRMAMVLDMSLDDFVESTFLEEEG